MQVGPTAVPAALKSVFDRLLLTLDSNCGEPSSVLHPRRPTYPALPVGLGLSTPANVHVPERGQDLAGPIFIAGYGVAQRQGLRQGPFLIQ